MGYLTSDNEGRSKCMYGNGLQAKLVELNLVKIKPTRQATETKMSIFN